MNKVNKKHKIISLFSIFSQFIVLREDVKKLKIKILKTKKNLFIFDFEKIDFVSRSALHELILTKKELKAKNIEVVFKNVNLEIEKALLKIQKTKKKKGIKHFEKIDFKELV